MNILAFDTALDSCSIAIQTASGDLFYEHIPQDRGHAEILVPKIEDVMEQAELSFHDLNLLATTVGPGSFTGLRTGLAAAQGYSLSTGLPIIGITTLEMLAHSVSISQQRIIAVIDSKRSDFYYQIFDEDKMPLTQPDIILPENVANKILERSALLVGSGAEAMASYLKHSICTVHSEPTDARVLIKLARERYLSGQATGHPNHCKPLYLREADAQAPRKTEIQILDA